MKRIVYFLLLIFLFSNTIYAKSSISLTFLKKPKSEYYINEPIYISVKPNKITGNVEYRFVLYDLTTKKSTSYFSKRVSYRNAYNFKFNIKNEGKYYIIVYVKRAGAKNYLASLKSSVFTVKKKVELKSVGLSLGNGEERIGDYKNDTFYFDLSDLSDGDSVVSFDFVLNDDGFIVFNDSYTFGAKANVKRSIRVPTDFGFEDEGVEGVTLKTLRDAGEERSFNFSVKNKYDLREYKINIRFK
ncbi:hypothetical protein [Caloramator australicus]|uniref:Uncharacterized protein n=1 Tax=Caloramator australicus RC3 TaxID=857293 RepID=I7KW03_9CLOT|nr:hypothetical protein [Caloramator australicus]CCJ34294.1 hypothetical protein CAAU_2210 [Caloramator australicus RC3]